MRVLVTGSSGRIGRYVVAELAAAGHEVTGVDVTPPKEEAPGRTMQIDLTAAGEVYQALTAARAEAVIHMGAWANVGIVANTRTYGDNVRGTFNLFQACADLGIKRVVSASSAQVYGFAGAPPVYAPVDEAHPLRPINCYALSKMAGEQAADYFVANYGLTILSFRLMGVRTPAQLGLEMEKIAAAPEQAGWLLWTRLDARDAALACRLAVEADTVPSGPYNITGAEVALSQPAADLIKTYFGDQTEIREGLTGQMSPLSCARAKAAFGYEPRFIWTRDRQHSENG